MRKNAAAAAEPTESTAAVAAPMYHPALELSAIIESPLNPRKRYDEKALEDMAATMRASGVLTPVLVRHTNDAAKFELAAGHRRCRAARLAGLLTVPATIRHLNDREFLEILHLENLQREDVDPLDEALGYEQLMSQGYDVSSLAEKIGKSITYVATRMRLLTLGAAARAAIQYGYLPISHANELARVPESRQRELLQSQFNLDTDALEAPDATYSEIPADAASPEQSTDDEDGAYDDDGDEDLDTFDDEDEAENGSSPWADKRITLDVDRRADRFAKRGWESPRVPTIEALRREIKLGMRRLKVVEWDLKDADLVPQAGACSSCAKRSGATTELFAEFDVGEDVCLDASCFSAKMVATEKRQRAESPDDDEEGLTTRIAEQQQEWKAQEAKRRAADQRDREKRARERERQQRADDAVMAAVCSKVGEFHFLDTAFLRVLLLSVVHQIADVDYTLLEGLMRFLGLEVTEPEKASFDWREERLKAWTQDESTADELIPRALTYALMADGFSAKRVEPLAELLKVPVKDIAAKAKKERPTKPKVVNAAKSKKSKRAAAA